MSRELRPARQPPVVVVVTDGWFSRESPDGQAWFPSHPLHLPTSRCAQSPPRAAARRGAPAALQLRSRHFLHAAPVVPRTPVTSLQGMRCAHIGTCAQIRAGGNLTSAVGEARARAAALPPHSRRAPAALLPRAPPPPRAPTPSSCDARALAQMKPTVKKGDLTGSAKKKERDPKRKLKLAPERAPAPNTEDGPELEAATPEQSAANARAFLDAAEANAVSKQTKRSADTQAPAAAPVPAAAAAPTAPESATAKPELAAADPNAVLQGEYSWPIEGMAKLNQQRLCSPVFQSGHYKWQIVLYPDGNKVQHHLSVYLAAVSDHQHKDCTRDAHYSLTVHNQKVPPCSWSLSCACVHSRRGNDRTRSGRW